MDIKKSRFLSAIMMGILLFMPCVTRAEEAAPLSWYQYITDVVLKPAQEIAEKSWQAVKPYTNYAAAAVAASVAAWYAYYRSTQKPTPPPAQQPAQPALLPTMPPAEQPAEQPVQPTQPQLPSTQSVELSEQPSARASSPPLSPETLAQLAVIEQASRRPSRVIGQLSEEIEVAGNTFVAIVPVEQQPEPGNLCGFYAVRSLSALNLCKKFSVEEFFETLSTLQLPSAQDLHRQLIQHRTEAGILPDPQEELTYAAELHNLIKNLGVVQKQTYTILPPQDNDDRASLQQAVKKLQTAVAQKSDAWHAFIINTSEHWLIVVAHVKADSTVHYYIFDSLLKEAEGSKDERYYFEQVINDRRATEGKPSLHEQILQKN